MLGVRLQPADLAQLDAWIVQQPVPRPSRPEAIRRLLKKALPCETSARALPVADLNANNDE